MEDKGDDGVSTLRDSSSPSCLQSREYELERTCNKQKQSVSFTGSLDAPSLQVEDEVPLDAPSVQVAMDFPITASLGPMGPLLRLLHSLMASEHCHLEGVCHNDAQRLKEGLEALCVSLLDVSEVADPSCTAKWWMKEVRELCYDVEDYFNEVAQANVGGNARACKTVILGIIYWIYGMMKQRPHIENDFTNLMARVEDASERRKCFQLPVKAIKPGLGVSRPKFSIKLPVSSLPVFVRGDESMHNLMKLLALEDEKQKQLKVVPIYGFPGVGKTTFARTLYNNMLGGKFQCRAFVKVSRSADMRRILTSILSQIKAPRTHVVSDVQGLIDNIAEHLHGKRYFFVIDDLWTSAVWDIITCAFPDNDCCCRIIITTQIEDIASSCCSYQSERIFKMEPLSDFHSEKLFFNTVLSSECLCPDNFKDVSVAIIGKCGGLPLITVTIASLLASEPNLIMEKWIQIEDSLPSTLRIDPTSRGIKEVLNLIYNHLPPHLKTCLLYLTMYPEGCTIRKNDLVKKWVAEGFVTAMEGEYEETTARVYFDELVRRGLIQPVGTNVDGEVLSCTIHHLVLDLIRHKSMEDNFIISVDYHQSTINLPNKVRRLSIQFGGAKSAHIPESIVTSRVRSLLFCGFFKCVPPVVEYRLLRILALHIWADQDNISFDLTTIHELLRLRYLEIECNITVHLPDEIRGLQDLETLYVHSRLSAVPSDIVHLESLLHLQLPSEANLPIGVARMVSLRTLGCFDLSSNSEDNLMDFVMLTNLQDLHLTCSNLQPSNLERKMDILGSVLGKLNDLKSVTLVPARLSDENIVDNAAASSTSVSCDGLSSVSPAPYLIERLELSWSICLFSTLPEWIGKLSKLRILKIALRSLSTSDVDILKGLPALTALSLYMQTAPAERIVFSKAGFLVLTYFRLRCGVAWLKFDADAMPNLLNLKLRFSAPKIDQEGTPLISIEHLPSLKEIHAEICGGTDDGGSVSTTAIKNHPNNPRVIVQLVSLKFNGAEGTCMTTVNSTPEKQTQIRKEDPDECLRAQDIDKSQDNENQHASRVASKMHLKPDMASSEPSECTLKRSSSWSNSMQNYQGPQASNESSSMRWLPPSFNGDEDAVSENESDLVPSLWSETTGTTSSTVPSSGSDLASSMNVSDMSAGPMQRTQYLSLEYRPDNLRVFSYSDLMTATRNLSRSLLVGEGSFGCVYRGTIKTGASPQETTTTEIAVKNLNWSGFQGHKEWLTEVCVLGIVDHPNLVKLIGYCDEDDERGIRRLLVYEFMRNRSLDDHLTGRAIGTTLSWAMRLKVALDVARGLKYLHEDMDFQIIFRDLKTSNILLDEDWNAKLSDFGMARQGPDDGLSHVSTAVVGTIGYAAPEYINTGRLTAKSDVWSYGVVLYELITGRRPIDRNRPKGEHKLLEWVRPYISDVKRLGLIVDPRLEGHYNIRSVAKLASVANRCLTRSPKARPRMSQVLDMVQKVVDVDGGNGSSAPLQYSSSKEQVNSTSKRQSKKGFSFRALLDSFKSR